eukprot:GHVR01002488.1.p2 GENE.GHVR01002488.1~~GHVR01002488.1.p2  ORF type:complete len:262 (+),score=41.33 GHVR01002488.1:1244-2029(+)
MYAFVYAPTKRKTIMEEKFQDAESKLQSFLRSEDIATFKAACKAGMLLIRDAVNDDSDADVDIAEMLLDSCRPWIDARLEILVKGAITADGPIRGNFCPIFWSLPVFASLPCLEGGEWKQQALYRCICLSKQVRKAQEIGHFHGDLRPPNVVQQENGNPLAIDWDFASQWDDEKPNALVWEKFLEKGLRQLLRCSWGTAHPLEIASNQLYASWEEWIKEVETFLGKPTSMIDVVSRLEEMRNNIILNNSTSKFTGIDIFLK